MDEPENWKLKKNWEGIRDAIVY